jgi:hypothetical protein
MAVFRFTVGRAFLKNKGHPITIPKSQVPYRALEAEGLSQRSVTIVFPRGERFEGQIYHGEAGYGEYYQLQMRGEKRTLPRYISLNDRLFVTLAEVGGRTYATLEYRE